MTSIDNQISAAQEEWRERFVSGPIGRRWDALPPQVGDPAPDLELQDSLGEAHKLAEFWSEKPALLIFWRHQGCSCGFDRAKRLATEHDSYVEAGGNVVVIGQAEPERAHIYAQEHSIPCPVLCDPELEAYRAFGLREGGPEQVVYDSPSEYWATDLLVWRPLVEERQRKGRPLVDNPWQLPGEFVVDTSGTLKLTYHYNYCENYPDPLVHVAALKLAAETND